MHSTFNSKLYIDYVGPLFHMVPIFPNFLNFILIDVRPKLPIPNNYSLMIANKKKAALWYSKLSVNEVKGNSEVIKQKEAITSVSL